MCKFDNNVAQMLFKNCDLFKRSFTDRGIGFTFNNEIGNLLYKHSSNVELFMKVFNLNERSKVLKMKSAGSQHALRVMIENNLEEIGRYENTQSSLNRVGMLNFKPINILVSLHNPTEPSNIRSKSFQIPLGHSTTVYITPKAREIDDSGKELSEIQRGCRLRKDSQNLDIFKIYSQEGCILECIIKQAHERCGCFPWNYLTTKKVNI